MLENTFQRDLREEKKLQGGEGEKGNFRSSEPKDSANRSRPISRSGI